MTASLELLLSRVLKGTPPVVLSQCTQEIIPSSLNVPMCLDYSCFARVPQDFQVPGLQKRVNIDGDAVTGEEFARILSEASGKEISYVEVPLDQIRAQSEDMAELQGVGFAPGLGLALLLSRRDSRFFTAQDLQQKSKKKAGWTIHHAITSHDTSPVGRL